MTRRARARLALWMLGLAVAGASAGAAAVQPSGQPLVLEYRALVAGAPVGRATVTLHVADDGAYRIRGVASSNGWLQGFTDWRNRFSARGRVLDAGVAPEEFRYHEQDRDKDRRVVVRRGTVQVTKNGRKRPARQAPQGPDLLSALFVAPACGADQVVHTGRHRYRLKLLEQTAAGCRFRVLDDDQDSFELEMEFDRRADRRVPRRITVRTWLTGSVELVASRPGAAPGDAVAGL